MSVLDAQDLFLAAGAVLAGGGLKHTDGDHFIAGLGGLVVVAAASDHGSNHDQAQQHSNQFFHHCVLLTGNRVCTFIGVQLYATERY